MANPKEKRRYIERRYNPAIIRTIFMIPTKEQVINLKWDRENNVIVIETLLEYDKSKGDI